jgi:alanyl aminopeptidase
MRPFLLMAAGVASLLPSAGWAQADSGRLSRDVTPAFESVRLVVDPAQAEFTGSVHVELEVTRPTATFSFHADGPVISALRLSGPAGPVRARHAAGPGGRVAVTAERPLSAGAYTLDVDFSAPFDSHAVGLYRARAGADWYAFTQFEATDARRAFPCWDEPSFKIPYQITLIVPSSLMAVSNTPVESETAAGLSRTVIFKKTPPLPSYLLAVAAGPFDTVPIPGLSVPGRVVAVKGRGPLAAEAARVTPALLAGLERYFGRPYPFEKLDLLAVPEYWPGAMENPGAVTFADQILLVDPKASSVAQRRLLIDVIAHELAHMWFGDLVTMAWWDDLWLNESFASWMGHKVTQQAFPETEIAVRSVEGAQEAMAVDSRLTARAIRQPVKSMDNLLQAADALAYEKGAAVLGMFEAWMGEEPFQAGIRGYLAAHASGNATAADLWSALSKASGKDVGRAMGTFLDQPGVPLVAAELADGGKAVRLSQRRFVPAGVTAPRSVWEIPVVLKYSADGVVRTRTFLLREPSQEFALGVENPPVDWIHPNAGERGYYRWSAPAVLLTTMAERAASRLEVRERVGFVGNVSALLDAGLVHGGDALRLLSAFAADPEPLVLSAVVTELDQIRTPLVTPEAREAFATYVRRALGEALGRIGLSPRAGEPESATDLRPRLLWWAATYGEDAAVRAYAREVAQAYLIDPTRVDPGLAGAALEVAAATAGDRALFDQIRKRLETTTLPGDRMRLFEALGHFRDPALVREALALRGASFQEGSTVMRALASTAEGSRLVFDWQVEHYDDLKGRLSPMFLAFLPNLALKEACSEDRLQPVRQFYSDPRRNVAGTDKELAMRVEEVHQCMALRAREAASAAAYLHTVDPR